ncbi:MAG: amidohydrolase family protein [bacterium]|nr:amidohydrolase family protein [bacterium]
MLTPILLSLTSLLPAQEPGLAGSAAAPVVQPGLLAIKARRVEVGNGETLEHAVILIEGDKIVTIGEDLPIERGIPVLELDDDQVVMPGLVVAYSRLGMSGSGYNDSRPYVLASAELYPANETFKEVLEAGVTTLGLYPAGNGIPGQAVAVQPHGDDAGDMILSDNVYLKAILRPSRTLKRYISDGFKKADEWLEKEKKNREKWEKDQEKAKKKKSSKSKKDDEKKDDEKEEDEKKSSSKSSSKSKKAEYEPIDPDPRAQAFLDLRDGELKALFSISNAASYLHLIDAIDDEEFAWDLRMPLTRTSNFYEVKDEIAETERRVVMEPLLTLHPNTMRQRNLPAEFARAGAKLVLVPRTDSTSSVKSWLRDTGVIIAAGLERKTAVRAMTLEAAELLGLGESHGSLEEGKVANLIILGGDPFEPATEIDAVMLGGEIVSGEVDL